MGEDRDSSSPGASMLWRRLEGEKHIHLEGLGLPTWKDATKRAEGRWEGPDKGQHPGLWTAACSCKMGEPLFAERALTTAYESEASKGKGKLLEFAAKRLPPALESLPILRTWDICDTSTAQDLMIAMQRYMQPTWTMRHGERVAGLCLYHFSGNLRHSDTPNLVLTFVANACLGVATRDIEEGEELTVSYVPWSFDVAKRKAEAKEASEASGAEPSWVPDPFDNSLLEGAHQFLVAAERAAWFEGPAEQLQHAKFLKRWILEFRENRQLQRRPHIRMHAEALLVHLCTGLQLLDDAWYAAELLLDDLCHVRLEEATQICTSLAMLGGFLSCQQQQVVRAQELFVAADKLLAKVLGPGCWEPWLRSLVPEPLLSASLSAWHGVMGDPTAFEGPPGLGLSSEGQQQASSTVQVVPANLKPVPQAKPKQPMDRNRAQLFMENNAKDEIEAPEAQTSAVAEVCPVGEVEVKEREGLVVVSLSVSKGLHPSDILVDASSLAVRFEAVGWTSVEVTLPRAVDVSAAPPASYQSRHHTMRLKLPCS